LLTFTALAVVSVAAQITEACWKLYNFWESVKDAPECVASIMEDLLYLLVVVQDISRDKADSTPSIILGLKRCEAKIRV
jgi:hypothetical protein